MIFCRARASIVVGGLGWHGATEVMVVSGSPSELASKALIRRCCWSAKATGDANRSGPSNTRALGADAAPIPQPFSRTAAFMGGESASALAIA